MTLLVEFEDETMPSALAKSDEEKCDDVGNDDEGELGEELWKSREQGRDKI